MADERTAMDFVFDENNLAEYMAADRTLDFMHPAIDEKAKELLSGIPDEIGKAKAAYEFVRDEIRHSFDIGSERVTKTATEVLLYGEGTCYSKSMLLAALLRHEGFAAGFCYQRIARSDIPDSGYFLHAMNVVYFHSLGKWVRLDARGGKDNPAQFSTEEEFLTYKVRPEMDEIDFPTIFSRPLRSTLDSLEASANCADLMHKHLPTNL